MKKIITLIIAVTLAGCATTQPQRPTPAQFVAQFCPIAAQISNDLTSLPNVSPKLLEDLAKANTIVAPICAAGAAVDTTSLQSVINTAVPLLTNVIATSGLPNATEIILGIDAAKLIASQIQAAK